MAAPAGVQGEQGAAHTPTRPRAPHTPRPMWSRTRQPRGQHRHQLLGQAVEVQGVVVGVHQAKRGVKGQEDGDDDVEQLLAAAQG